MGAVVPVTVTSPSPVTYKVCGQTLTVLTNSEISLCTRTGEQAAQEEWRTREQNTCMQLPRGTSVTHTSHADLKLTWNETLQFSKLKCFCCVWFKPRQKFSFRFPWQNICIRRHWEGTEVIALDDQRIQETRLSSVLHLMEFISRVSYHAGPIRQELQLHTAAINPSSQLNSMPMLFDPVLLKLIKLQKFTAADNLAQKEWTAN